MISIFYYPRKYYLSFLRQAFLSNLCLFSHFIPFIIKSQPPALPFPLTYVTIPIITIPNKPPAILQQAPSNPLGRALYRTLGRTLYNTLNHTFTDERHSLK